MRPDLFSKFDNATFSYDKKSDPAINNLSVRLRSGLVTAVLGASGSGKTTFMKMMLGLLIPTSGTIRTKSIQLEKKNENDLLALRHNIGFIPQNDSLMENLTVYENITLPVRKSKDELGESADKVIEKYFSGFDLPCSSF